MLTQRRKDHIGGALLALMGISALYASGSYRLGTLTQMGSGYFPSLLGFCLLVVGLLIAFNASPVPQEGADTKTRASPFELRAWSCILLGVVAFSILGTYGGFVPASSACVFIAALGDRRNTVRDCLLLAVGVVVAGYLLFEIALKVQFSAFSWG